MRLNVQYGCGLSEPEQWINFDASPTLRLQRLPVIGEMFKKVEFPKDVQYGDIVKRLPGIKPNTCDAIYCSHVLEHLSLNDFKTALKNTFTLLKPGGIFRCVLPDLEQIINQYINDRKNDIPTASILFMRNTLLGVENRPAGIKSNIINMFGNFHHLWMWDKYSLREELLNCGFQTIRECNFGDSANADFTFVEDPSRFVGAIAFEAIK